MKRVITAGLMLALGCTGAHADPFLAPLLVAAGVTGQIAIGTGISYASIAAFAITAGAALPMKILRARR